MARLQVSLEEARATHAAEVAQARALQEAAESREALAEERERAAEERERQAEERAERAEAKAEALAKDNAALNQELDDALKDVSLLHQDVEHLTQILVAVQRGLVKPEELQLAEGLDPRANQAPAPPLELSQTAREAAALPCEDVSWGDGILPSAGGQTAGDITARAAEAAARAEERRRQGVVPSLRMSKLRHGSSGEASASAGASSTAGASASGSGLATHSPPRSPVAAPRRSTEGSALLGGGGTPCAPRGTPGTTPIREHVPEASLGGDGLDALPSEADMFAGQPPGEALDANHLEESFQEADDDYAEGDFGEHEQEAVAAYGALEATPMRCHEDDTSDDSPVGWISMSPQPLEGDSGAGRVFRVPSAASGIDSAQETACELSAQDAAAERAAAVAALPAALEAAAGALAEIAEQQRAREDGAGGNDSARASTRGALTARAFALADDLFDAAVAEVEGCEEPAAAAPEHGALTARAGALAESYIEQAIGKVVAEAQREGAEPAATAPEHGALTARAGALAESYIEQAIGKVVAEAQREEAAQALVPGPSPVKPPVSPLRGGLTARAIALADGLWGDALVDAALG